jgi:hypothetical protein
MDRCFGTMSRFCWYGALVASIGCWQEVHYKPDKPVALTPVVDDYSEETAESETDSSTLIADQDDEPEEVTADELFGTSEDAALPTVPSGFTPPDVIAQPSDEEDRLESPEFADIAPDLAVELPLAAESAEPPTTALDSPSAKMATNLEPSLGAAGVMRPSRTALAVWQMSSRWSFAAAIYAKGQPEDRYRDSLEQATYAAELVGVELPTLPVSEGMDLEAAVIGYLLDGGLAALVNKLSGEFVPEYEALAKLAIRTNALLLVYTPKSQQLDPLILSIRQSAVGSGLPPELWVELVSMLGRREPFADVKQRVLSFHTEVGEYLAGEP